MRGETRNNKELDKAIVNEEGLRNLLGKSWSRHTCNYMDIMYNCYTA